MAKVNGFDAKAWIETQAAPRPHSCCICKNKEAADAVRTVGEAWAGGAIGINLKKIAEQVLNAGFGFTGITGNTVQRHFIRCEPELWEQIDAIRTTYQR